MLTLPKDCRVFVSNSVTDMRKSTNGLSALVLDEFKQSPTSCHVFVFHNRARDKVKILFWDRNGFVLYYKRLSKGRFKFTIRPDDVLEITHDQLSWLLAGLDFQLMHQFNELNYSNYY